MQRFQVGLWILLTLFLASSAAAGDKKPVTPQAKDKCPVCGMFPAKHPDFMAQIVFKDGTYALFDGTRDLFKYYFKLEKYNPSKKRSEIDAIYVTDYYSQELVDGFNARYVAGSNVYGPMGKELIAFAKEKEAREFMVDHIGKSMLTFDEITYDLIKSLN